MRKGRAEAALGPPSQSSGGDREPQALRVRRDPRFTSQHQPVLVSKTLRLVWPALLLHVCSPFGYKNVELVHINIARLCRLVLGEAGHRRL